MKTLLSDLTFNVIMRMVAGKRYYGDEVTNKEEARQFKELIDEVFKYGGASNPEDFLPLVKLFTGNRYERKVKSLAKRSNKFLQGFIDEHRSKEFAREGEAETMVDHLLSLQKSQPQYYTNEIIKGLISIMLLTGTDTSAATLEWALSNLVNHPEILEKARGELDSVVGQDRLLDESDLSKLPYLHSIISETLRLYPVAPLLVPHYYSNDCTIGGYNVPRNTILLVNAWAIHRDPKVSEEPATFKPERFDNGGKAFATKDTKACPDFNAQVCTCRPTTKSLRLAHELITLKNTYLFGTDCSSENSQIAKPCSPNWSYPEIIADHDTRFLSRIASIILRASTTSSHFAHMTRAWFETTTPDRFPVLTAKV